MDERAGETRVEKAARKSAAAPACPSEGEGGEARGRGPVGRIEALWETVRGGSSRFVVAVALALTATVLGVLRDAHLFGEAEVPSVGLLSAFFAVLDGDSLVAPDATSIVARLICALQFALPFSVVAQLLCEWRASRGLSLPNAPALQVVAAAAAGSAYDVGLRLAVGAGRGTLFLLAAFGLLVCAVCAACWLLSSDENEDQLAARLVRSLCFTGFLTVMLGGGLGIVVTAAEALLGLAWGEAYSIILTFCTQLVFPCVLCSQLPRLTDELRTPRSYTVFVGLIVYPLCLLLLGVLYLYVVRITVSWSMPSGEMNWYGSFALLVYVCLWLGMRMVDSRPARWFVRWGWALLVPVVVVQVVGIAIRLRAYGLTTARHAGLACLVVGIVALVLGALRARPRALFVAAGTVAVVACISPANVIDVPNRSQAARLGDALEAAGMVGDDGLARAAEGEVAVDLRERIESSWDYLRWSQDGYFGDPLVSDLRRRGEEASFEELFGFARGEGHADEIGSAWWWVDVRPDDPGMDVSGFSRVYSLDAGSDAARFYLLADDGYLLNCTWSDGTELTVSLNDTIEALVLTYPSILEPPVSEEVLVVDARRLTLTLPDGRVLVVTHLGLGVSGGDDDPAAVESVEVGGLLLVP